MEMKEKMEDLLKVKIENLPLGFRLNLEETAVSISMRMVPIDFYGTTKASCFNPVKKISQIIHREKQ